MHDRPFCKGLTESPSPITFLDCGFFAAGKQSISKEQFFVGFVLFCFVFFFWFSGFVLLFFGVRAVLDQCQSLSRYVFATVEISGDEPNSRSCRRSPDLPLVL